ncbi:hypothetical protein CDAR_177731 [Caerostris darwini]|uniref:Uncharacterized protein n=1 Tax=Caerostris darwini TaxID=1538125 RepID=A0AAV4X067_9ARAC|nr:hypothetical protein CDAR_177731 [Caerostris darwini]
MNCENFKKGRERHAGISSQKNQNEKCRCPVYRRGVTKNPEILSEESKLDLRSSDGVIRSTGAIAHQDQKSAIQPKPKEVCAPNPNRNCGNCKKGKERRHAVYRRGVTKSPEILTKESKLDLRSSDGVNIDQINWSNRESGLKICNPAKAREDFRQIQIGIPEIARKAKKEGCARISPQKNQNEKYRGPVYRCGVTKSPKVISKESKLHLRSRDGVVTKDC